MPYIAARDDSDRITRRGQAIKNGGPSRTSWLIWHRQMLVKQQYFHLVFPWEY
jgi:hypothetical protein